jgi:dipeptidyl aminopeptidase/acylaminoacyl peptidase
MSRALLASMIVLASLPAAADPAKRPATIDEIMRLKVVTGLSANPAGPGAVVQVQEYDGGARFLKDLWLVAPGGEPRRLTTGGTTRGSFAFSPDGKEVAFAGERQGKSGIHAIAVDGGEPRLVAALPMPADNLRWVGKRIHFNAPCLPACKGDLACTKKRLDERADGPSALIYDDLYFRPWDSWRDGTVSAVFRADAATGQVEPVVAGDFDVPPPPFGGVEDYAVGPDGAVVYAAKKKDLATSTNTDLFVSRDGVEKAVTDNPAADRAPALSPDGRRVAYLAQAVPGFESDRWRLVVMDLGSGERFEASAGIDDWVMEHAWAADGKTLYFTVEERGRIVMYRVAAKSNAKPERMAVPAGTISRLSVGGDGRVYATIESILNPAAAFAIDPRRPARPEPLTAFNRDALAALDMPVASEIDFDGAEVDGKRQKVQAWVVRPAIPAGVKAPLVVMVHGGPQGAFLDQFHSRWNPVAIAAKGFVVVLPNITGSTGFGQAFVNAVSRDWGGRPFQDVLGVLDWAAREKDIDATRACAMGGSYGGYMMNWIEGHTDRFKCLVSHAGPSSIASMYGSTDELWFPEWDVGGTPWDNPDAYAKVNPVSYAKAFRTPMLVIHGALDFRVPLEQALIMYTTLKRVGVEARLMVFPDETHFVTRPKNRKLWYDTVADWLASHTR